MFDTTQPAFFLVLTAVIVLALAGLIVLVIRRRPADSGSPGAGMSRQEQIARLENRRGQTVRIGRGESAKAQAGLRHSNFGPGGRG